MMQAIGLGIRISKEAELNQNVLTGPLGPNGQFPASQTFCGKHLEYLEALEVPSEGLLPGLKIEIACDVKTPLIGEKGSTAVFSGQKGASESDKIILEKGMKKAAQIIQQKTGINVGDMEGAGAAGGLPAPLVSFCGAKLKKGVELVGEAYNLEHKIQACDLVFTGEGK